MPLEPFLVPNLPIGNEFVPETPFLRLDFFVKAVLRLVRRELGNSRTFTFPIGRLGTSV